jgi:Domain of unknown function (DUF362)
MVLIEMNRRRFLSSLAAAFAALTGLLNTGLQNLAIARERAGKSRVVSVFHPGASGAGKGFDNDDLDQEAVRKMVNAGILTFTGEHDLQQAWRKIIPDPTKKVAVKINCQIQGVYTKAKVVQPLVEGMITSGVAADNIIIYDMTNHAFDLAGFKLNLGAGVKVGRVADYGGFSRFLFHRLANLLTGGYENSAWNFVARASRESRFSSMRFLASMLLQGRKPSWDCEYLINVPVLKALDGFSGVTLSMKNHYGSFGNPSEHHDDIMDYIPFINSLPEIRNKTRLIVMDAVFGEYKWVNGRDQKYVVRVNKVLISDDPVAIDTLGWQMIEELRKNHGIAPLAPQPVFIAKAAQLGLGQNDSAQMEQIELRLAG